MNWEEISCHVLTSFNQGFYTPTPVANLTEQPSKNITFCSNHTALFNFDPAAIIQSELKPGLNLSDLQWPSAIQDGIRAVELGSKIMFVLYCMGAAATGIALVGALIGVFAAGRLSAFVNFMFAIVSHHVSQFSSRFPDWAVFTGELNAKSAS